MTTTLEIDTRLTPAFALEAKASPSGEIEGLASPYGGQPDAFGDVIAKGAFAKSLAAHRASGTMPALLWAHDQARPVGRWSQLNDTSEGLHVEGKLNLRTTAGRDAYEAVSHGDSTGLSIGYIVAKGGAQFDGATRVLGEIDLFEISLVTIPASKLTRVRQVKSRADFRDLLHENGLPRGAAEKLASGGWPALSGVDPDDYEIRRIVAEAKALAALLKG